MPTVVHEGFLNAFANDARHKKSNGVTLDMVCEAAYQGDVDTLTEFLKTGDVDRIFNGDINMHFTDVNALHMASISGEAECVKLLLGAKADPHIRTVVTSGNDPKKGETACDKASRHGHDEVVKLLKQAEAEYPVGWYVANGIGNNRKLYAEPEPGTQEEETEQVVSAQPVAQPVVAQPAEPPLPICLMFPGQGSQYVKMLDGTKDIPEVRAMLDKAQGILGYDILELCLEGPEEKLGLTKHCQPALFIGGLAGIAKLRGERAEAVTRARCMAGLSLGEYTALCAAGVFDFEDGLRLVQLRGEAMQEAAAVGKQAMCSIAGLERKKLDELCKQAMKSEGSGAVCQVANALFPKGFAVAGTEKAVLALKEAADKAGALQSKLLKTSGAFHTPLMQPAQEKLQKALEDLRPKMRPPRCTVYMNVTAEPVEAGSDPGRIVDLLSQQLVNPVLWEPLIQRAIKDGLTEFFECGPQKQLKAMMKRISQKTWNSTTSIEV